MCRKRRAGEPGLSCASSPRPSLRAPAPSSAPSSPSADASSGVRFGIQDDAWLVHGPGTLDERLDRLERLGVDLVRFNLHWDRIEARSRRVRLGGQRRRPGRPSRRAASPPSSASSARRAGRTGAGRRTSRPARHRSPRFARDAATRYRWVSAMARLERAEPGPLAASDDRRRLRSPDPQSRLRARFMRSSRAPRSAGGVTAPRASAGGVSPVAWIRGMRAAGARLDAYAHHPYPSSNRETPFTGGCGHCTTITMATLERLSTEVGRAFGPKRIWLTEYGYQTGSLRRQPAAPGRADRPVRPQGAQGAARRHADPLSRQGRAGGGALPERALPQTGRPKLAALAFPLPLAQAGRSGGNLVLWGQVRPRAGVQTFRVQVRTGGVWRVQRRLSGGPALAASSASRCPRLAARLCGSFRREDDAYSAFLVARLRYRRRQPAARF